MNARGRAAVLEEHVCIGQIERRLLRGGHDRPSLPGRILSPAPSASRDGTMRSAACQTGPACGRILEPIMTLDPAHCYEAVLSRDRRFDGRFFAGVVTTGVYCRPICPVKPARPQNVRWFACAAAAEAAGFRPCRRCRPETAPGTPAWTGTSAVVSRALRLIAAGALNEGNMEVLTRRLGVGARQLRRLFGTHLGASPMQVARARRVHFARALIDETD